MSYGIQTCTKCGTLTEGHTGPGNHFICRSCERPMTDTPERPNWDEVEYHQPLDGRPPYWATFDLGSVIGVRVTRFVPESRLREVEAELCAALDQVMLFGSDIDRLRADLRALVEALERLVLAGRYINIAPPREDDANRQSDHDEFYAANQAGEVAARAAYDAAHPEEIGE